FTNHNGKTVTHNDFADKIYVADFFFTTCPTICPTVMSNMIKIHDKYIDNPNVLLLSHTLDPKRDTIGALKAYANNLEIDAPKWNLVTGDKKIIRGFAQDYMNIVVEDNEAPGGINHSGKIILVDKDRRIRAFAEGTDANDVEQLLSDIDVLLAEYE
ncbi:SCO family protein, partial [Saprospiraceae bacterium]|nr:SCO family protein [Saprospiraceae bacterium]